MISVFMTIHSRQLNQATQFNGDRIIEAVRAFLETENRLPYTLEELVPEYLKDIPKPNFRYAHFKYHRDGLPPVAYPPQLFAITYDNHVFLTCSRSTSESRWLCRD